MLIDIRFLRDYRSGDKTYRKGHVAKVNEDDAKSLIEAGIIERYDPQFKPSGPPPLFFGSDKEYCPQGIPAKKFWGLPDNDCCGGDDSAGFETFADFCLAVKSGHDPRLSKLVQKDLSEGIDASGGFTVPDQFRNELLSEMLANAHLLTRVLNIPMTSNSVSIPAIYDADRSSTGMHGIDVPTNVAEAETLIDISPTFAKLTLKLSKMGGRCRVSNEMLQDSPLAMSMLLPRIFSEAISFELIDQLINGTGVGQMLGILNAPATVSVTKESGQAADTILYENVIKMWSRLLPSAKQNAVWLACPDAEVWLRSLVINVGTGGSSVSLVNISETQPSTLFGRPLFFCEQSPALGDAGDLCVFNPRAYGLGRKQNDPIRIDISEHARFENDQTVFRAICRADGQPLQTAPITPKNGGNTLSHFVMLGERA